MGVTGIARDFMGAGVVTQYAMTKQQSRNYGEINRLTREATGDYMNRCCYGDGGKRRKLVHMKAVYSKKENGRIGRDLREK